MAAVLIAILQRDLRLAWRRPTDIVSVLFFFVMVASLFPLGVGPEMELLKKLGPGVLWVAALLATLLSLPGMFAEDYRDGSLEQLALSPQPFPLIVFGKVIAHWLVSGLPLCLLAPLLGLQFGLPGNTLPILFASLLLGTPALSAVGAIGAALTLGVRGGGLLLSLLILPLYIPLLLFGAGAIEAHLAGLGSAGHFSLLAALTLTALGLSPWVTAAALKIALE